jgi:hypothetical protein
VVGLLSFVSLSDKEERNACVCVLVRATHLDLFSLSLSPSHILPLSLSPSHTHIQIESLAMVCEGGRKFFFQPFLSRKKYLNQGTLTEGEGSVRLTPSLEYLFL